MINALSRWRPSHLLAAWTAYWTGLAVATLTPMALAVLRATSAPRNTSSVNASIADNLLHITVTRAGATTYSTTYSLLHAALWIAGPPLAIWAGWLVSRARTPNASRESGLLDGGSPVTDVYGRSDASAIRVPRQRD